MPLPLTWAGADDFQQAVAEPDRLPQQLPCRAIFSSDPLPPVQRCHRMKSCTATSSIRQVPKSSAAQLDRNRSPRVGGSPRKVNVSSAQCPVRQAGSRRARRRRRPSRAASRGRRRQCSRGDAGRWSAPAAVASSRARRCRRTPARRRPGAGCRSRSGTARRPMQAMSAPGRGPGSGARRRLDATPAAPSRKVHRRSIITTSHSLPGSELHGRCRRAAPPWSQPGFSGPAAGGAWSRAG